MSSTSLLSLLQLVSPTLPVGAYSYSEGLETLVDRGQLSTAAELEHWLTQALQFGAIRLEAAIAGRAFRCFQSADWAGLSNWNDWLSAFRETEEMRQQSWQMGRSLSRLLSELAPELTPALESCGESCNFAVAFAIAAAHWQIDCETAILGYLQTWSSNLINAGVRLIPLGQTAGQKLLLSLAPTLNEAATTAFNLPDDSLNACTWGLTLASMNHETLYSRIFRS